MPVERTAAATTAHNVTYLLQIGRAGRDGKPADVVLYYAAASVGYSLPRIPKSDVLRRLRAVRDRHLLNQFYR